MGLFDWFPFSKKRQMGAQIQLVIRESYSFTDGGTICLTATDQWGREREVKLVQAMTLTWPSPIPGRLYLDNEPVPIRSELETQVLTVLRAAKVQCTVPEWYILDDDGKRDYCAKVEEGLRDDRDLVVNKVESEQYVLVAAKVEQARRIGQDTEADLEDI